ncbi:MAG: hypothetical protein PWP54_1513 [Thermosipho sp. (in: thermotogales)]|nr:hypothetical protein [Thermosipho sp. (in: thermotogales)]MDN5325258.1 hypothetical protein [Thermosipho sp. (in: thermotogales)]
MKKYYIKEYLELEKEIKNINYELYKRILNKVNEVTNNSQNIVETNLRLYHIAWGQHNYYGVFESLSGRYESYSIYTTFLLNYLHDFSPEFIVE